jgi:protein-S-isoprenylcysteine O-methyltransferase Ste14
MGRWASLSPAVRIASLGAAVVGASLLLPWYGIQLEVLSGFSQTGLEAFGFAHAALLATVAAALALIWRCAGSYTPPRPLTEGALLIAAGIWSGLLLTYLAVDRPDQIAGFGTVRLRYGIFVAAGGAAAMFLGGLRMRQVGDGEAIAKVV